MHLLPYPGIFGRTLISVCMNVLKMVGLKKLKKYARLSKHQ